ncbi:MAG: hypothetical protein KF701_07885 [Anaerolineales bacterium]|nr:MAG: hypothetical protein KF701_07885 [Anaerolineales bacterium]
MNDTMKKHITAGKAVDRAAVLTLLQVGLNAGEMRFVRQVAEDWLNAYPYDLHVELLRAQALIKDNKAEVAFKVLRRLCELDPEFLEAQEQLAKLSRRVKPAVAEAARAAATLLRQPFQIPTDIQDWAQHALRAQQAFKVGDLEQAELHVQAALLAQPPSPLPALLHIQIAQAQGLTWLAIENLVELYSGSWPHCLQLRLLHANFLMESGQENAAVDALHDCAAEDVSGQVARRMWGAGHRFAALWPAGLQQAITTPIPAKVAAGLGWNQIDTLTFALPAEAKAFEAPLESTHVPMLDAGALKTREVKKDFAKRIKDQTPVLDEEAHAPMFDGKALRSGKVKAEFAKSIDIDDALEFTPPPAIPDESYEPQVSYEPEGSYEPEAAYEPQVSYEPEGHGLLSDELVADMAAQAEVESKSIFDASEAHAPGLSNREPSDLDHLVESKTIDEFGENEAHTPGTDDNASAGGEDFLDIQPEPHLNTVAQTGGQDFLEAKSEPAVAHSDEAINETLQHALSALPETLIDLEEVNTATAESLRLRADGRFPAYILLSSKENLVRQYGMDGFASVDASLRAVAAATDALPKWGAYVVYADDPACMDAFGLNAVSGNDPWAIKHLLADLDEALRQNGEMIGALMIVGGPKIVPFHHLPNPVDDDDKDVPSDNPYASLDENYFVPTWPAGRLPTGTEKDPTALLKALNRIEASRDTVVAQQDPVRQLITRLLMMFGLWKPKRSSFGYTAQVWQRASHSVYRTIGEPKRLSLSPPTQTGKLPKEANKALQVAYFNLHGVEDGPDWYGQRDPLLTPTGPDYPVALSPSDVVNHGRAPQVVFSEACFGANIFNKTVDNALALKFIDSGSKAVVGSTVTSYGAVSTPLIAADLLGQTFWRLLNEGHPAGEALRRAKIAMAQTMHRRQGYLDGEDQKTLISFILYGDPLAQVSTDASLPKRILRAESSEMNTVCDLPDAFGLGDNIPMESLPQETLATVKAVVKEYLPGMQGSEVSVSHEHTNCQNHNCPLPHPHNTGAKRTIMAPSRSLVTLSKKVQGAGRMHPKYARITMDAQGKVVKLAVSR